ncbi:MAG: O-antigen ligase family protein [Bacteroidetes bacterium]|nr:O-antigen ligase family protein [Bacteroidota bacterium]
MSFSQKVIRFLFCAQLVFGLLFSSCFSKAVYIGSEFNIAIHIIVFFSFIVHLRFLRSLKMSFLILIFTFFTSFINGFVGLRAGMFLNFLTFSVVEIALIANTFSNFTFFFKAFYYSYGFTLFLSVFLIFLGYNTQPFTGMYMSQKVNGVPVQIWGLFSDKNVFGFMLMLLFLSTLLLPEFKFRKLILVMSFIFLVLSGNRSGFLTVCIIIVMSFLINPDYMRKRKFVLFIESFLILSGLIALYLYSPLNTRGVESEDREALYNIAYYFIRNHFWFGIGRALIIDGEMIPTHNLYIQLLAEEGFFCLLIYVLLFLKVLIRGSYSIKVLCLSLFIFTIFNPMLVPGQLFSVAVLIIFGRGIDEIRENVRVGRLSLENNRYWFFD